MVYQCDRCKTTFHRGASKRLADDIKKQLGCSAIYGIRLYALFESEDSNNTYTDDSRIIDLCNDCTEKLVRFLLQLPEDAAVFASEETGDVSFIRGVVRAIDETINILVEGGMGFNGKNI